MFFPSTSSPCHSSSFGVPMFVCSLFGFCVLGFMCSCVHVFMCSVLGIRMFVCSMFGVRVFAFGARMLTLGVFHSTPSFSRSTRFFHFFTLSSSGLH